MGQPPVNRREDEGGVRFTIQKTADSIREMIEERTRDRPDNRVFETLAAIATLRLSNKSSSAAVEVILAGQALHSGQDRDVNVAGSRKDGPPEAGGIKPTPLACHPSALSDDELGVLAEVVQVRVRKISLDVCAERRSYAEAEPSDHESVGDSASPAQVKTAAAAACSAA
ncbi:hypothetical protein BC628DRAFT_1422806 [Trametes gibbosa]|nr:hypothetical protein BC628DRAFT_1422806 [Trametes gibbosa]